MQLFSAALLCVNLITIRAKLTWPLLINADVPHIQFSPTLLVFFHLQRFVKFLHDSLPEGKRKVAGEQREREGAVPHAAHGHHLGGFC